MGVPPAPAVQRVHEPLDLGSLAAAVQAFHGQEGAGRLLRVRAEDIQDLPGRTRGLFRAGFRQFRLAAVAVGDAQRMHAGFPSALHVKAAVAHHPGFPAVFRQGPADQVLLFRTAPLGADHRGKEAVQAEMLQDPAGEAGRFPGHDAEPEAAAVQRAQDRADSGINPVLKQADRGIALPVSLHGPGRLRGGHAHVFPEGILQRRPDHFPQDVFPGFGETHPLRRVTRAVPDALLGPGQRPVQVEQDPGLFFHTVSSPRG